MRRRAFLRLVMPDSYLRGTDQERLGGELAELQLRAASRFDASARLAELAPIPTLIVAAQHDRIALPAYGSSLTAAIPGARLVELPDAGHGVTIQCAGEINRLLAAHFAVSEGGGRRV
jgi:3-oxoadipate enol-lactonase